AQHRAAVAAQALGQLHRGVRRAEASGKEEAQGMQLQRFGITGHLWHGSSQHERRVTRDARRLLYVASYDRPERYRAWKDLPHSAHVCAWAGVTRHTTRPLASGVAATVILLLSTLLNAIGSSGLDRVKCERWPGQRLSRLR